MISLIKYMMYVFLGVLCATAFNFGIIYTLAVIAIVVVIEFLAVTAAMDRSNTVVRGPMGNDEK